MFSSKAESMMLGRNNDSRLESPLDMYADLLNDRYSPPPRPILPSLHTTGNADLARRYRENTLREERRHGSEIGQMSPRARIQKLNRDWDSPISNQVHSANRRACSSTPTLSPLSRQPPTPSSTIHPFGEGSAQASRPALVPQACFSILVNQVASLVEPAKARTPTPDPTIALLEAAPLQTSGSSTADPIAWSARQKWAYTLLVGLTMFNGSFASTAPNGAGTRMRLQFGLTEEEIVFIATSFVGGCVAGPLLWAPLSEIFGRRIVFLISTFCYTMTNIGCALAPTKTVLFVCRFLAGAFASSAFSNAAAVITDLFAPKDRARPMIVQSLAPLLGPCFGPLFGSAVALGLGWPFVFWFLGVIGLVLVLGLTALPETYKPVIAAKMKNKNGQKEKVPTREKLRTFLIVNLGRPVNMMFREPIVMCATFYLSFFFALMYVFFASWPLIFGPPGIYKLDTIHTGITFLPMGAGGIIAALLLPLCERYYVRRCKAAGGPVPEARLLPTFFVAPLVAIGLLWAGWLGRKTIPWQVAMLAGVPIGAAMVLVFQGWIGYLGDCYRFYSSSAIAATVIGRSLSGATIPLATHRLHEKLGGISYLYTMLAGLVVLTIPMPYLVFRYGERLRSRSLYKPGRA